MGRDLFVNDEDVRLAEIFADGAGFDPVSGEVTADRPIQVGDTILHPITSDEVLITEENIGQFRGPTLPELKVGDREVDPRTGLVEEVRGFDANGKPIFGPLTGVERDGHPISTPTQQLPGDPEILQAKLNQIEAERDALVRFSRGEFGAPQIHLKPGEEVLDPRMPASQQQVQNMIKMEEVRRERVRISREYGPIFSAAIFQKASEIRDRFVEEHPTMFSPAATPGWELEFLSEAVEETKEAREQEQRRMKDQMRTEITSETVQRVAPHFPMDLQTSVNTGGGRALLAAEQARERAKGPPKSAEDIEWEAIRTAEPPGHQNMSKTPENEGLRRMLKGGLWNEQKEKFE